MCFSFVRFGCELWWLNVYLRNWVNHIASYTCSFMKHFCEAIRFATPSAIMCCLFLASRLFLFEVGDATLLSKRQLDRPGSILRWAVCSMQYWPKKVSWRHFSLKMMMSAYVYSTRVHLVLYQVLLLALCITIMCCLIFASWLFLFVVGDATLLSKRQFDRPGSILRWAVYSMQYRPKKVFISWRHFGLKIMMCICLLY